MIGYCMSVTKWRKFDVGATCHLALTRWMTHGWSRLEMPGKLQAVGRQSVSSFAIHNQIYGSYCSTVHFRRITSVYLPTNADIISHKAYLKHFKTLRHVSILSDHHQGVLFLAKVILRYSQFNSYLQTRCCGSISCCVVEQWLGVRRTTHT